jgi:TldD protein
VRIANVGIAPGPVGVTPDDLIADVKDGLYFSGTATWSIDQRRLNMQFGGDMVYRIRNGKKAGMIKDVVYRAIAPEFWGSCDGIAGPDHYRAMGVMNCGKGQPEQVGRMTHGTSDARFRGVEFGPSQV